MVRKHILTRVRPLPAAATAAAVVANGISNAAPEGVDEIPRIGEPPPSDGGEWIGLFVLGGIFAAFWVARQSPRWKDAHPGCIAVVGAVIGYLAATLVMILNAQ